MSFEIKEFKEIIITRNSLKVYNRVLTQMDSADYKDSNCAGFIAYLLAYQDNNIFMDTVTFMENYIYPHPNQLIAKGDRTGSVNKNTDTANVCIFGDEQFPGHIALFLGSVEGILYQLGSMPGNRPRIDTIPTSSFGYRKNYPDRYYLLTPRQ